MPTVAILFGWGSGEIKSVHSLSLASRDLMKISLLLTDFIANSAGMAIQSHDILSVIRFYFFNTLGLFCCERWRIVEKAFASETSKFPKIFLR